MKPRRSRVLFRSLGFALALAGVLSLGCDETVEREAKPLIRPLNVALVVLDTTRADAVEGYGARNANAGAPAHTPTIARLAREGALFENARTTSAWTLPSHGSIFTARFPSRHGAHAEGDAIASELTTLGDLLGRTHAAAGFSENPHIVEARGFARGFDHFEETWREPHARDASPPTEERVAQWLAARDREEPWFLFINLMTPHLPYAPPDRYVERFAPTLSPEIVENFRSVEEGHARMQIMGQLGFKRIDFSILRALYRADVAWADERLGDIVKLLERADDLDDTLLIVVSDHGENIGHHGLMEHQFCLYESLLRVPLVVRWPEGFEPGSVRSDDVQLVDLLPTILEALDWPREEWPVVEGRSLIADPAEREPRPVYAELMRPIAQEPLYRAIDEEFDFAPFLRRLKSIQVGNLKLIASENGEAELYDLARDPGERVDLARQRPEDVERLRAQLLEWSGGWEPRRGDEAAIDDETREALRALGYAE